MFRHLHRPPSPSGQSSTLLFFQGLRHRRRHRQSRPGSPLHSPSSNHDKVNDTADLRLLSSLSLSRVLGSSAPPSRFASLATVATSSRHHLGAIAPSSGRRVQGSRSVAASLPSTSSYRRFIATQHRYRRVRHLSLLVRTATPPLLFASPIQLLPLSARGPSCHPSALPKQPDLPAPSSCAGRFLTIEADGLSLHRC
ncbi:hypothetical protein AAHA92_06807 [Salvia divinorum]|uniref:Uncharacterized protein n=1 Tax=Salvia divinorum TaxID=28513 RepID=A0ABD1I6W4_SALDI